MSYVPVQDLLAKTGSIYKLVVLASKRAVEAFEQATDYFEQGAFDEAKTVFERLQNWIEEQRTDGLKLPRATKDWQRMLVDVGYDLGKYGPDKDGVDGKWGTTSRLALLEFQKTNRADDTGMRDHTTAVELARVHAFLKVDATP